MPPTAFCRNLNCSASFESLPTTAIPPIMSEWPLRYFVTECTTRSNPKASGR